MCEVKHLYEATDNDGAGAKEEITLEQLIDKLRHKFDLNAGSDLNVIVRKLAPLVYYELARTMEEDRNGPSDALMGHRVDSLLDLSTWNAGKWTEQEFTRRVDLCNNCSQPLVLKRFDPCENHCEKDVMKVNLGVYCWITLRGVFRGL